MSPDRTASTSLRAAPPARAAARDTPADGFAALLGAAARPDEPRGTGDHCGGKTADKHGRANAEGRERPAAQPTAPTEAPAADTAVPVAAAPAAAVPAAPAPDAAALAVVAPDELLLSPAPATAAVPATAPAAAVPTQAPASAVLPATPLVPLPAQAAAPATVPAGEPATAAPAGATPAALPAETAAPLPGTDAPQDAPDAPQPARGDTPAAPKPTATGAEPQLPGRIPAPSAAAAPAPTAAAPTARAGEPQPHAAADAPSAQAPAAPAQPSATTAAPQPAPAFAPTATAHRAAPLHQAPRAVAQVLELAVERGLSRAKLSLRPADLGGVEIRLQTSTAGVTAQVVADSPEAARLLQQAAGDLRRALERQDVTLLSLDVSTTGDGRPDGSSGASADLARDRDRQFAAHGLGRTAAADGDDELPTPIATIQLSDGVHVDVLA